MNLIIKTYINENINASIYLPVSGKPPTTGACSSQMDSNAESIPLSWRHNHINIQWNLSVTTTSVMKLITCDLSSNVF